MSFTPGAGTRFLAFSTTNPSSGGTTLPGPLSITGGTATTNTPVLSATQTWNNAAVTFTGWQLNVTDTASNASSLLMDLQVGGVSQFAVRKSSIVTATTFRVPENSGTIEMGGSGGSGTRFQTNGGSQIRVYHNGGSTIALTASSFLADSNSSFSFTSGDIGAASDLFIRRDAANTLAQRNGVNAQTLRVYNTFTDASNYERGKIEWASNVLQIGTEKAGTGTARALDFQTDGTSRWSIAATSNNLTSNMGGAGIVGFEGGSVFCASGSVFKSRGIAYLDSTTGNVHLRPGGVTALLATSSGIAVTGFTEMTEQTAPAAPAANSVRIYAEDNGSGKTRLMALFATGAAQQIAIEP